MAVSDAILRSFPKWWKERRGRRDAEGAEKNCLNIKITYVSTSYVIQAGVVEVFSSIPTGLDKKESGFVRGQSWLSRNLSK